MVYIVFDLDRTLVNMTHPVWSSLHLLQSKYAVPNSDIKSNMSSAYNEFVNIIAKRETSKHPLGILRPGILKVMKAVLEKRKNGSCKGVIMYTNNSDADMVNFSRDLIHRCMGAKIFDDCIYVHHHLRAKRTIYPDFIKTWSTLRDLLIESLNIYNNFEPQDVLFYDDQDHTDLMERLGKNYIKVEPYVYEPEPKQIAKIAFESLRHNKMFEPGNLEHLLKTVEHCFHFDFTTCSNVDAIRNLWSVLTNYSPRHITKLEIHDSSITLMLNSFSPKKKVRSTKHYKKRNKY